MPILPTKNKKQLCANALAKELRVLIVKDTKKGCKKVYFFPQDAGLFQLGISLEWFI